MPCQLESNGLGRSINFAKPLATLNFRNLASIELQDEEPERRRKIALLTLGIDDVNKSRQGSKSPVGNLLEPVPELILQAYACLVAMRERLSALRLAISYGKQAAVESGG